MADTDRAAGADDRLAAIWAGLDVAPNGILVWGEDRRLLYVNDRFRKTCDLPASVGMTYDAFVSAMARSHECFLPCEPDAWEREEIADFGVEKQRDYLFATGAVMQVTHAASRVGGMTVTFTDVTAIKRNETALQLAKEAAEATDEAKSRFLRAANHDLRQPLASLKILIYNCIREPVEEHRSDMLHAMGVAVSIMEDLLGALLQIGQLDAGRIQPRITSFQLSQLFERLDIQFRHQAEEKALRLKFVAPRGTIATDRALLERILSNFVANAIRFTEVGGVVVGCRREGKNLRIEVVDTGRGVRPQDRERVFDEFYRATEERRMQKNGLGLGLNIVKRLAELLEHPVRLRSEVGKGSIFSVTVPLGNIWHSEAGREVEISEAVAGEFVGTPVILVEDDDILRETMTQLLRRWGIDVHAAADESEAIRLVEGGVVPQLIVADYNLKTRTGVDVVEGVRQAIGAATPAMIVTADAEPRVLEGIRAAGLPVLVKPVSPPRLRVLMHNLLFEPSLTKLSGR
ncbi:ATP-binding protein [Methylopila sp. 73B]|uniref:ATP-binding protein n=1 Tax=Methylopila sp. 73B TaxID=1120792 RepID=UPI00035C3647|nr:ATP-binding protein [Methylopila sp. 73B]